MVNNAGINFEAKDRVLMPLWELSDERWDATMAINVKGVFLGCKYAAAQMVKQEPHESGDRGWIINMSSIFGLVASAYGGKFKLQPTITTGI